MLVKVCGVTSVGDAEMVAAAGVDAVGLNFSPGSPRCVSVEQGREIVRQLAGRVRAVGVFVDAPPEEVERTRDRVALDVVQLHGDEPPEQTRRWAPDAYWKAVRTADEVGAHTCTVYLLDADVPGRRGGTGVRVPLDRAAALARRARIVLAGGLTPDSVAEAIRVARPYGVDVASGVECSPGRKDRALVKAFVAAARSA